MRILRLLLALPALLLAAAPCAAQQIDAGARVRLTAPIARGDPHYVGTVVSTANNRVVLRLDPAQHAGRDTISIPRSLIRRVEISMGSAPRRGQAMRTGAIAGLAAGVGLGLIAGAGIHDNGTPKNPWLTALWVAPAMSAAGAGAGALFGRGEHEEWRTLTPGRQPGGIALGRRVSVSIRLGI
jgi:hypothetical protein